MRSPRILRVVLAFVAVVATPLVAFAAAAAQSPERILRYAVEITIEQDASIVVSETIDYDFGSSERHGIFRDVPTRLRYDDTYDRIYQLEVLSVSGSPGTPVQYVTEDAGGGKTRIRIGDPDRTITGEHTYVIGYRMKGAMNGFSDHDELFWNAIGSDWPVPIDRATASVTAPGPIEGIACYAGPFGSNLACERSAAAGQVATFGQRSLDAHQAFTVVAGLPKGVVAEPKPILEERRTLRRAFSTSPPVLGALAVLLLAVVAGFGRLAWRTGRDRRFAGSQVDVLMGAPEGTPEQAVPAFEGDASGPVEFAPPDGVRPGQIGTLIDEVSNPLDVTATVIDLAVRKYLVIQEIPKKGWFGKPDWKLTKLKDPDRDLLEYERGLLDGLFEDGDEVKLSSLRRRFVSRLHDVQAALYRDAVAKGWFSARPDQVRQRWVAIGVGVLAAGIGLEFAAMAWTRLAVLPLAVILGGLLLMAGAKRMPRRTAKGTGMVRRVRGFRTVIETAETNLARFAERENLFIRYLPYAIVFGLTEKWARAFEVLGESPPDTSWYVSQSAFAYGRFSEAMDGFTVTSTGTIASTPSSSGGSGFGGGSSGGGGGGGGGGSW
ncbi:MAG: DUF2207 domain-containing protein [Actinomycetota bacterium]